MPSANGKQTSVQPRFDDKSVQEATSYLWTFWDAYADPDAMPAWGAPGRADKMRQFSQSEPILIGALSSMTSKAVSLDWQISGGRNRVLRYQELLAEAEAGAGWSFFLDRWLQDYHVADQGGFIELGRQGKRGPVIGLYNMDAGCCQLTARQKSPMAYYPRVYSGAIGGKRIPFEPGDYARIVDMPSPNEAMGGMGFSACSRAFKVAKVLQALYAYEDERLRDMPIPGIAAITGMTSAEVKAAFNLYEQKRAAKEQVTFKGVLWLAAQSSPINPIDVKLTSFASLPEGFDKRTTIELYVYTLALDFGVDVREFWPASQTGATKAEAEVQAEKAKGKGFGRMLSSVERALNWDVLPEGLEFAFDQKDSTDDLLRETIREKVIANISALAGGQIVSIEEARRWLVELEMAPEWLAETDLATVHGNANVGDEDPDVVEQPDPVEAEVPAKTPPVVDQAVAAKAARARLGPGEDFVAVNGAGDLVTLWSSRRVFAVGAKKYDPSQHRAPVGSATGGQWTSEGGAADAADISENMTSDEIDAWIDRKSLEYGGKGKFLASDEYKQAYPVLRAAYQNNRKSPKRAANSASIVPRDGKYRISLGANRYLAAGPATLFASGDWAEFDTPQDAEEYARKYGYVVSKGGEGSGHFGHAGRPGEVGGSAPGGKETYFLDKDPIYQSEMSQEDARNSTAVAQFLGQYNLTVNDINRVVSLRDYSAHIVFGDSEDGGLIVRVDYRDANGTYVGDQAFSFKHRREGVVAHADLMRFMPDFQSKDLAQSLAGRQFQLAIEKKFDRIETLADISIGKYAWAKMGFQYANPSAAEWATENFRDWCRGKDIELDTWPTFKTPQDVINFKSPEYHMHSSRIYNDDIKPGLYDLGKAFMLDDSGNSGHGDWDAVYDLKPLHGLY